MSIDFMVFDPASAPRSPRAFRAWYRDQTDWKDDCNDPSIATPAIQGWYRELATRFPDANQPGVDPRVIDETYGDYNFTGHVCYVAFRARVADEAWALIQTAAAKHQLGTYDPNSEDEFSNECIRFPDGPLSSDGPTDGGMFRFFGRKS